MILVDTNIWIDHIRNASESLSVALDDGVVLTHPIVIGELACAALLHRSIVMDLLSRLPGAPEVSHAEALTFIERNELAGSGLGYVDIHLLASTKLAGDAQLWTRDRRLRDTAGRLGLAFRR